MNRIELQASGRFAFAKSIETISTVVQGFECLLKVSKFNLKKGRLTFVITFEKPDSFDGDIE